MRVPWFQRDQVAVTDSDEPGRCTVTWEGPGGSGVQCYGWIEGGTLFLPSDGYGKREHDFTATGLPDPAAHWYECATGKDAIYGIPGAVLAVIA